jgi:hypothetical protein
MRRGAWATECFTHPVMAKKKKAVKKVKKAAKKKKR